MKELERRLRALEGETDDGLLQGLAELTDDYRLRAGDNTTNESPTPIAKDLAEALKTLVAWLPG